MRMLVFIFTAVALAGCGLKPTEEIRRAERVISHAEEKIQENESTQKAQVSELVFATNLSLGHAEPSQPVLLAREFNNRAQTLVGPPDPAEAAALRQLIGDLLSEIEREQERGERVLAQLDARLAKTAKEKQRLEEKFTLAEEKLRVVSRENAILADRELEREANWWNPFYDLTHSLKKFLVWAALILALFLLLPILSVLFPVIAPAVQAVGSLVGMGFGWLMKAVPGMVSGAGLIAKEAFDLADATKNKIVDAIETWQNNQKVAGQRNYQELARYLSETLDAEHKKEITRTKEAVGWV